MKSPHYNRRVEWLRQSKARKAGSIYSLLLYRSRWIPGKLGFHIPQALVAPLPFDHVISSIFEITVPKGAYKFPFSGDFR